MKPRILYTIVVLFFFASFVFPQTLKVHGVVSDKATGVLLSYANIRVQNSTLGTSANINGEYELKLQPGTYKLIASFIGY
ncbi:MAG: carboxypeptidase-like regulatory domain-containing protein, partial [Melioribacteraceae bacterium]|nr:carboxypeptidase-like regulatory domain-containing protein [Melioribacteraceae bacterium]